MTAKRLLVIDDEPEFGEFVRKVAVELGYEAEVTTHGKAFMRAFDAFKPTTVVLDIVMPDIEGIELVQWLAERRCTADVIIVSGYNPNYTRLAAALGEARGLKSVSRFSKPVKLAELRAALGQQAARVRQRLDPGAERAREGEDNAA